MNKKDSDDIRKGYSYSDALKYSLGAAAITGAIMGYSSLTDAQKKNLLDPLLNPMIGDYHPTIKVPRNVLDARRKKEFSDEFVDDIF